MPLGPRLLYFVTEDWYFCSHRLALARAAQNLGYQVTVLTRVNRHNETILSEGFNLIPLDIDRGGINPLRELKTLYKIWQVYARVKPDIVHHVALKPVLYGSLVSMFFPSIKTVNLLAGLGAIFSSKTYTARLLRPWIEYGVRLLFRRANNRIIVQNREDYAWLVERLRISPAKVRLIKGSGVDDKRFFPVEAPSGAVKIAMVSRLLWDKGVGEYVAAVRLLKRKGLAFTAFLVGEPDAKNIASVDDHQVKQWRAEGDVDCLGHIDDVAKFWRNTHIAVLPSYREGLPKSLLEAAASGRPIVTTATSGCMEVVEEGVNGLLVPVGSIQKLADALEKLINDEKLRKTMGEAGRKLVEREFSDAIVLDKTLAIYRELQ